MKLVYSIILVGCSLPLFAMEMEDKAKDSKQELQEIKVEKSPCVNTAVKNTMIALHINDFDKSLESLTTAINQIPEPVLTDALKTANFSGSSLTQKEQIFVWKKIFDYQAKNNQNKLSSVFNFALCGWGFSAITATLLSIVALTMAINS